MDSGVKKAIADIQALRVQGAGEVAKASLKALAAASRRSRAASRDGFLREMEEWAIQLGRARPTEPAARNMLAMGMVRLRESDSQDTAKLREAGHRIFDGLSREIDPMRERIAEEGYKLISDGDVVLTHCHSRAAIGVLLRAKKEGRRFGAIVTETRPLYQGLLTARDLSRAGIPVTYCVDSASGSMMGKATKVLVGCDLIHVPAGSIVNKVGTLPIAVLARQFGKPFYVACSTVKAAEDVAIEERSPAEVLSKRMPGVTVANPAFDVTPAELVTAIITEKGILRPEDVGRQRHY
jgi:ribose 1,5-bisphosphate isomerase